MEIRLATPDDLNRCLELDDSFETEYVWQMEQSNDAKHISTGFRLTRLPRPMRVSNGISRDQAAENFARGEILLVSEEENELHGFVEFTESDWNQAVSINNLVVPSAYRRQGIGKKLLSAATDWGKEQGFRVALATLSTKHYPGICFLQKNGFVFCGFNDQWYANRDIAMMFALGLR